MNTRTTLSICVAILLAGGGATLTIFSTEPTARKTGAVRETAMLVEVVELSRDTHAPTFVATSVVEPSQDVTLRPRVSGQVLARAPGFTPGGIVARGDTLLRIDPADYENALARARSDLRQAEADLQMEMGRQKVAEQDYALLDTSISEEQRALVLREPQLETARSVVEAARAAVAQAELALARTVVTAPFDAHILSRNANVGSQVSAGDDLGRLVGLETYWVSLSVPLSRLRWLDVPEDGASPGSPVVLRNRTAWDEDEHRDGHLYRLVGALADRTRMARVLVAVSDPLGRETDGPPLVIGSFVEATVKGRVLEDVIRLDRGLVRTDDTVWVMEADSLRIRDVAIVLRDATHAYVRDGLEDGDLVVTTNLATVSDGAPLRLE